MKVGDFVRYKCWCGGHIGHYPHPYYPTTTRARTADKNYL